MVARNSTNDNFNEREMEKGGGIRTELKSTNYYHISIISNSIINRYNIFI